MADNNFQKLLDAEEKAEKIVSDAYADRDRLIEEALQRAQQEERHFEQRIPEIHESFRSRALQRADQVTDEIKRRYEERVSHLRELADEAAAQAGVKQEKRGRPPLTPEQRFASRFDAAVKQAQADGLSLDVIAGLVLSTLDAWQAAAEAPVAGAESDAEADAA